MSDTVLAALIGAGIAGVLSLIVQTGGIYLQHKASTGASRAKGLADYLGATHSSVIAIGMLASLPLAEKAGLRWGDFYTTREGRETDALNAIRLLDPEPVVDAAARLHDSLVRLENDAQVKVWPELEWREHRERVVAPAAGALLSTGRKHLGRASSRAIRKTGTYRR
jgi:hypothetical protein